MQTKKICKNLCKIPRVSKNFVPLLQSSGFQRCMLCSAGPMTVVLICYLFSLCSRFLVSQINLRQKSDFSHRRIKLPLFVRGFSLFKWRRIEVFFFPSSLPPSRSLFFNSLKNRRMEASKAARLVNKHPAFPKRRLCSADTGIPQLQLERHRASPWDLYLAFAMLLMKYFINNVNILDGRERERESCRQSFHMHCHSNKMFRLYLFRGPWFLNCSLPTFPFLIRVCLGSPAAGIKIKGLTLPRLVNYVPSLPGRPSKWK